MIKKTFTDLIKYLPSHIIPMVVGIISIPIITNLFSPSEYGDLTLIVNAISILVSLSTGWLSASVVRFYYDYNKSNRLKEFNSTVINTSFLSIGLLSVILLTLLFIANIYNTSLMNHTLIIGFFLYIFSSFFELVQSYLRIRRHIGIYSFLTSWFKTVGFIIGILIVFYLLNDIAGILLGSLISLILITPILWKNSMKNIDFGIMQINPSIGKTIARYGLPIVIVNMTSWIYMSSDRYFLAYFRDSYEVGIYSASVNIANQLLLIINTLFSQTTSPIIFQAWEDEGIIASKIYLEKVTKFYVLIALPATVGLSALASQILKVLTNEDYLPGAQIIPLIALSLFFLGLANRFNTVLDLYKKTKVNMYITFFSAMVNIVLNFYYIPKYGYLGAAVTTLIAFLVNLILKVIISRRYLKWSFPFKSLLKSILASTIMGFSLIYMSFNYFESNIINIMIGVLTGLFIYCIMLLLLREYRFRDIVKKLKSV